MKLPELSGGWTKIVLRMILCAAVLVLLPVGMIAFGMPLVPLPDSQLIFEADDDGDSDIYLMDIQFGTRVKLTHNEVDDHDPAWSPQTRQIAFSSDGDNSGATEIYVMNENGAHLRRVTPFDGNYWNSAFSGDGQRMVYLLYYGNLHVMDLNTEAEYYLSYGFAPAWSPVDERIASYANSRESLNADVYVVDVNGQHYHNLTQHPANDWDPAWSPDGKQLVFVSSRDGNAELYVMDATCEPVCGANLRRLTDQPYAAITPSWSYDGGQIAFAADVNGVSHLFTVRTDGTNLRDVGHGRAPVWLHFVDR